MTSRVLALALWATGCGSQVPLEPVHHPLLVAGPIDCRQACIAVASQLFDAGVIHDCSEPEFSAATDCAACRDVFLTLYAVELPPCE